MKQLKHWQRLGLHVLIALIMVSALLPAAVKAETHWNNVITGIYTSTYTGETPPGVMPVNQWQEFRLNAKFELPDNVVKAGDKTIFTLPAELAFARDFDFPILAPDGVTPVAHAHADATTKTLTITYTDYPEHHSGVTGEFYIYTYVDYTVVTEEQNVPISIIMENGVPIPDGEVHYNGPDALPDPDLMGKHGWMLDTPQDLYHTIHINQTGQQISNAVLVDELQEPAPGVTFNRSTLTVKKGTWVAEGNEWKLKNDTVISNPDITWGTTADGRETFTIRLGDIAANEGYIVHYQVKVNYEPSDGEHFHNKAVLTGDQIETVESAKTITVKIAGGSAQGYVFKILIHKTDEEDAPLAGAKFDVIRVRTGLKVGEITTEATGTGELGNLLKDKYELVETAAPAGYMPLTDPIVIEIDDFNDNNIAIKQIVNKRIEKISIPVEKKWIGPERDSVRVYLLANGVDTGKTLVLNAAVNWKGSFDDLPTHDDAGIVIAYTVTEEAMGNYTPAIAQNNENDITAGFTITNTNTETISIPVTKQWVGTAAEKAVIELLADGVAAKQTELNAAGGWTHSFTNLPKYDPTDGHEIVYTLEEVTVPGYSTMITGSAENGFTITNTIEGKVSVGVTKKWVGPAAESVTVKLMNGAAEVAQQVLSKANNWQHVFADLDKYDAAGNPITYTLVEETVPGYSSEITGDMTKGFVVTNSNAARITIPVKKQWVGTAAAEVTVRLMDGAREVASKKLNAGNNWQHVFADLPQYDGEGKEILYSIKEDRVEGYSTVISGNQTLGFTVTNTLTGKVSIPVTKVWKGTALDRVTIHLLADGKEVAKQDLHKGNAWQHTFTDLEKYLNGKEINYSITEDPCPSYITEIVGTAQKGFVVTNSELKVPPTPPRHDPPARIEKPTPKPTEKERKDASVLLPRTGEKADRFVYGLGLVILALSGILLRKKLR